MRRTRETDQGIEAMFDREVEALYKEESPKLYNYLCKTFGSVLDLDTIRSCMGEGFRVTRRKWEDHRETEDPIRFTYTVAANRARKELAAVHKQADISEKLAGARDRDDQASPEETVLDRIRIEAAIAAIPRRQREAVLLCYVRGFSQQEVADIMQISACTVRSHLHEARRRLEDLLRQYDQPEVE